MVGKNLEKYYLAGYGQADRYALSQKGVMDHRQADQIDIDHANQHIMGEDKRFRKQEEVLPTLTKTS